MQTITQATSKVNAEKKKFFKIAIEHFQMSVKK